jgi:hypothetical protein
MRPFPLLLAICSVPFLAACASTTASRIADHRAVFAQYPAAVQQKIRSGQVDVGFTAEMVRLALGEPSRIFTRKVESGDSEVWVYHDDSPRFSVGFGLGSFGRHSATSVGVATSTGGYDPEERMRVAFRDGQVSEIEVRTR